MPIIVKNHFWSQTSEKITLKLPLNDIHSSKVDIFVSPNYLKANYPPYYFELFPLNPINDKASTCTITDNEIIFELLKTEAKEWPNLERDIPKSEAIKLKQQILQESVKNATELREEKEKLKAELQREAVRNQMALDSKRLEAIEGAKQSEREKFTKQIRFLNNPIRSTKSNTAIPTPEALIRKPGTITISFSKREFKTPVRESRTKEEQEWLRKQTEVRKVAGWSPEDLLPEERDPELIRVKGNKFFQQQNYIGAISAYSYGISLSPKYASLYLNRSAAHFALGNLFKCLEDCSTALELLVPPVEDNLKARARCFARRGACLCKLGAFSKGVVELEAALKLLPGNEELMEDIKKAKEMVELEQKDEEYELSANKQLSSLYK